MKSTTQVFRTPFQYADAYKLSHWIQYPEDVCYIYSNFTPRKAINPTCPNSFVFFGLQAFLTKMQIAFQDFFWLTEKAAVDEFEEFYTSFFGTEPTHQQLHAVARLHEHGYLPLEFKALPEGSIVPHGVPVLTVINTEPELAWLTNFVESWLSAELWGPCTSATTAYLYRKNFDTYAALTSDLDFMPAFQGHDFSFRGMWGVEAASMSGAGHLLSFLGTDTLPAISWIGKYYPGSDNGTLGTSVPATEHSVMCAGGKENELETISRLLDLYPKGILSVVSDTWDFWHVVTDILPKLKNKIMAREGKLVIRPDSSPKTPVEIIIGDPEAPVNTPEHKGLIRCLHAIFGAEKNSKGYLELDSHIGAIYGDSITLHYQEEILRGLECMGYSSTNIVLGIGSFTYTYNTRDTHGIAMKATAVGGSDGVMCPIFKDPKTDKGSKKSHKGLLAVVKNDGGYECLQDTQGSVEGDCLKTVWYNGDFTCRVSFEQARAQLRLEAR